MSRAINHANVLRTSFTVCYCHLGKLNGNNKQYFHHNLANSIVGE